MDIGLSVFLIMLQNNMHGKIQIINDKTWAIYLSKKNIDINKELSI